MHDWGKGHGWQNAKRHEYPCWLEIRQPREERIDTVVVQTFPEVAHGVNWAGLRNLDTPAILVELQRQMDAQVVLAQRHHLIFAPCIFFLAKYMAMEQMDFSRRICEELGKRYASVPWKRGENELSMPAKPRLRPRTLHFCALVWLVVGFILVTPVFYPGKALSTYPARSLVYILLSAALNARGAWALFAAMKNGGRASIVVPLTALYPLVVVVTAPFILRESISRLQGMGIICALVAVALLST